MKENWTPKKLYNLLKETVIGQDEYIKILSTTMWLHYLRIEANKNLEEIKNMEEPKKKGSDRNIADLEVMYSNISEQIKI